MTWGSGFWGTGAWAAEGSSQPIDSLSKAKSLIAAFTEGPSTPPKTTTSANTTTRTYQAVSATPFGGLNLYSLVSQGNISTTPDLAAFITASSRIYTTSFLGASITTLAIDFWALSATLNTIGFTNLGALVSAHAPSNLGALIDATVANLPASIGVVWARTLAAAIGAHLPVDLQAFITTVQPSNLSAFVRVWASGTPSSISASITSTGGHSPLGASISVYGPLFTDFGGFISATGQSDFPTSISAWMVLDLTTSISHNYAAPDFRAIIHPSKTITSNLSALLRVGFSDTRSFGGFLRPVISAHTGTKARNIDRWPKPFLRNRFALGSASRGFSIILPEAIYSSNFPDLGGTIFAAEFKASNIAAFIRAHSTAAILIGAAISAVTPKVYINRVILNFVLFRSLKAFITQTGSFNPLPVFIRPRFTASTGTDSAAGFVNSQTVSTIFAFSSAGVVLITSAVSALKRTTYINKHPRPDLHAFLTGWAVSDFGAQVAAYPFLPLSATIMVLDLSRLSGIPATIQSQTPFDMSAMITRTGFYTSFPVSLAAAGSYAEFPVNIYGYREVLGREFITVHTKPLYNLGATINYDVSYSCSFASTYIGLSARLRSTTAALSDLSVSIQALRGVEDFLGTIVGLKSIRLKTMSLFYRTATRSSLGLSCTIKGWSRQNEYELPTSIVGLHHEFDLLTTLQAVRLRASNVVTAKDVLLVNLDNPSEQTTAEILFATGVSSYIYDAVDATVYSPDTGESWTVLVREVGDSGVFFDKPAGIKSRIVASLDSYDSFDEAIRDSLSRLTEFPSSDMNASLTSTGQVAALTALISGRAADTVSNFGARIFEVATLPSLSASITSAGFFSGVSAAVKAQIDSYSPFPTTITGWEGLDLLAEVVAVP